MACALRIEDVPCSQKSCKPCTVHLQVCAGVKSIVFRGAGVTCTVPCFPYYCPLIITSVPDPCHFGVDPYPDLDADTDADPAPSVFVIDLEQKPNLKKSFPAYYFF